MNMFPNIKALPDDAINRVIWWYGPVIKNLSSSTIPLVEIITRTIQPDNTLSENSDLYRVSSSDLDILKIGTIWQGRKRIDKLWGTFESQQFSFNFSAHDPESVHFLYQKPGSNNWLIPRFKYNLGNMPQSYKYHFFNSTLTKLTSSNNTMVLIPSVEFLTGAVSPAHKQIRFKLLQHPLDELTNMYVQEAHIGENKEYVVEMKEGHFDENIALLSYIRLNQISRNRLSKLWTSLEQTKLMPNGKPFEDRYPIVLPYHPTTMSLSGDGIWIDNNTFLILRITGVSQPQDFQICNIKEENDTKQTENGGQSSETNHSSPLDIDLNDQELTHENAPHWNAGVAHIKSGVRIIGEPSPITVVKKRKEQKRYHPTQKEEREKQDATSLSSDDPNSREESNGTAALEQDKLNEESTGAPIQGIIKKTEEALHQLVEDPESEILNFFYINESAHETTQPAYCNIHRAQLPSDFAGYWHRTKKIQPDNKKPNYPLRNFLVVKIILKDGRKAYLLEIERKCNSESFSGLIFNNGDKKLSKDSLTELLKTIVQNRGRYSKKVKEEGEMARSALQLPISNHLTFKHLETMKTLKNAIHRANDNNIFTHQLLEI
jgi:hypothetical protein